MNKKLLCLIMACFLAITPFVRLEAADTLLYAPDGRTVNVTESQVPEYLEAGWYESAEDAKIITVYASDGRVLDIPQAQRDAYNKVGWYNTAEDAKIITVYAPDGRTLDIPQVQRDAYNKVGWYNSIEDVTLTMYAPDGRSITVYKDQGEAYKNVGWFYNITDVSVTMYDENGGEQTVFNDNIEEAKKKGLFLRKSEAMQLMFSDDNRIIYVPFKDVEAHLKVGWYRGGGKLDPSRPMVALTFDDGPGKYTDKILSCLEKYGARATFFVVGKSVPGWAGTVKRAVNLGCEIGNHTWSHVNLSSSGAATISSQISKTNSAVYNAAGVYPKIYRPPYGAYNNYVLSNVAMPAIMWSVDTLDWKHRDIAKTYQSVINNAQDGAIILMHDIHAPTAEAAQRLIPALLKRGYQLVTVSELLAARKGYVSSGKAYNSAK